MKRPIYTIEETDSKFHLELFDKNVNLLLSSKSFGTFRECEKFLDILRVHMRFQTNFVKSKNLTGQYGFEVRTCWDELIATSTWFSTMEERVDAMQTTFDCNTNAMFVHTNIYQEAPSIKLTNVA